MILLVQKHCLALLCRRRRAVSVCCCLLCATPPNFWPRKFWTEKLPGWKPHDNLKVPCHNHRHEKVYVIEVVAGNQDQETAEKHLIFCLSTTFTKAFEANNCADQSANMTFISWDD